MTTPSAGRQATSCARRLIPLATLVASVACSGSPFEALQTPPLTFQKLTLGMQHTCGLTLDGEAYCWGEPGVLGTETNRFETRPAKVAGEFRFHELTTGTHRTCGLTMTDSIVVCWGRSGETWSSAVPTVVSLRRFQSISAGIYDGNLCGLTGDGDVFCWGSNVYGQTGTGSRNPVSQPTAIALPMKATAIGASFHACMLDQNGSAHCWGTDIQGQVGRSTTPPACDVLTDCMITTRSAVIGGITFSSLSVGGGHSCALRADGAAYCWGSNLQGQVGAAAHGVRCKPIVPCNPSPARVGTHIFSSITAGAHSTCAVAPDGTAYCWGENEEGQLGIGTVSDSVHAPTRLAGGIPFKVLYPGIRHSCGIATDDRAYCWGNNITGAFGNGRTGGINAVPQAVLGPLP